MFNPPNCFFFLIIKVILSFYGSNTSLKSWDSCNKKAVKVSGMNKKTAGGEIYNKKG